MSEELPERIRQKIRVDQDGEGTCWVWTGALSDKGYGRVNWQGKNAMAHRVVFELVTGSLPPELDHLCRNRACVNPDHLEGVTRQENVKRGLSGQRRAQCKRGHEMTDENRAWRSGCKICRTVQAKERYWRKKNCAY